MRERPVRFLSVENVLAIHADTIAEEGGSAGVRDRGLLESAVAMPQATFEGVSLHSGLAAMAAAYLFHLCQNHAFVDGNKRAAAFSTVLFLALNGVPDDALPPETELERRTLAVARGEMTKTEVTLWLQSLSIEANRL
jgi:death-on-curing protein